MAEVEQPTSETMTQLLRHRLERYGAALTTREALALVECAEAVKQWRDAPTDEDDHLAKLRLLDAIRAVEAL